MADHSSLEPTNRGGLFARSALAIALVACGASSPTPAQPTCKRAPETQRAAALPNPDATIEREVKTSRVTYVFRASRTANLVYALDCLAKVSRCSHAAYATAFDLDAADDEALRAWKAIHFHYSGTIRPREETSDPAELPVPEPLTRNLASRIRLASFGAGDVPGVLDRLAPFVEPGDVARAQSVLARFDSRFEKLWLARREDLAAEVEGFAALMARGDVLAIVESVARFYEPDLPAGSRETFELLARPEHEGSDFGEQLGDHALVETRAKERPEERLDVVLHELFHRWYASAPYAKKKALVNAFARSRDPFARAAYGLLNESLATSFGNGLIARAVNRPEFDKRVAQPLGLYHDRFIDQNVKSILGLLERWTAEGKTLYDPRFLDAYVARVRAAFPKGLAPVLSLRPMVSVYESALEPTEQHFFDAVSPGWSESEDSFGGEARALLAKRSGWGAAILVTAPHVDELKGLDKAVDGALPSIRRETAKKKPFVLTLPRDESSPAFVLVAPDAGAMRSLIDAFVALDAMPPPLWTP